MLTTESRFFGFPELQIWWPECVAAVHELLPRAPILTVMQCSDAVAGDLRPYAFRERPFHTLMIDLSRSEQDLWSQLHSQSCQYKIRKAERLGCTVSINDDGDEAFTLINRLIRRRGYRRPMSRGEWSTALEHGDVCCARYQGRIAAAHVNLLDPPHRVRLLFSATAESDAALPDKVVSVANRYLHWIEWTHYRTVGIGHYDFGGVLLDPRSSQYSIARFKLSFGGELVASHILRLARNGAVRASLRQLARAKALFRTAAPGIASGGGLQLDPTKRTR